MIEIGFNSIFLLEFKLKPMIVGNGLIGQAFVNFDREDVVFFASGVSNSLEADPNQFLREENLLLEKLKEFPTKCFVYFSTCSIYDSSKVQSQYVNHKLKMEHLVAQNSADFLIARVSNAVGKGGNQNTLINYLIHSIKAQNEISVHINATRNLIDVEDIVQIVLDLIDRNKTNQIVNVAYLFNYKIVEILALVENYLQQNAKMKLIQEGQNYSIETKEVEFYFKQNQLLDKEIYLNNILKKYY